MPPFKGFMESLSREAESEGEGLVVAEGTPKSLHAASIIDARQKASFIVVQEYDKPSWREELTRSANDASSNARVG
jgi:hypothetical protein